MGYNPFVSTCRLTFKTQHWHLSQSDVQWWRWYVYHVVVSCFLCLLFIWIAFHDNVQYYTFARRYPTEELIHSRAIWGLLFSNMDLPWILLHNMSTKTKNSLLIESVWVKLHQHDNAPFEQLFREAQLNMHMDNITKRALKAAIVANVFISSKFPFEYVMIMVGCPKETTFPKTMLNKHWTEQRDSFKVKLS